jgi:hypothetical protein
MAFSEYSSDPISVFNIVAGVLVVLGIIFMRSENQKGFVYKISN